MPRKGQSVRKGRPAQRVWSPGLLRLTRRPVFIYPVLGLLAIFEFEFLSIPVPGEKPAGNRRGTAVRCGHPHLPGAGNAQAAATG